MLGYDNIEFENGRKSRCENYKIRKENAKKEAEEFAEMWKVWSCSDKFRWYMIYVACCGCFRKNDEPDVDKCSELENDVPKFSNLRY